MPANDDDSEYIAIRVQVDALRDADNRTPIALHLGASQRAALEAHVRNVTGQSDVGPLLSFQGLEVRASKKNDHVVLLYAEGEDPDPVDPLVEIPPVPPEVPPSAV
ncbi:MAG: hypothetical protein NVSMB2_28760 [Chloroflexota bacterium]